MEKARSRLKKKNDGAILKMPVRLDLMTEAVVNKMGKTSKSIDNLIKNPIDQGKRLQKAMIKRSSKQKWLKNYLKFLPTLLMSLVFFGICGYILASFEPSQVRNMILPESYLPLLIAFFLATFFLFTYLFLSKRRGLLLATFLSIFVFLRLEYDYPWYYPILLAGFLIGVEFIPLILAKTNHKLKKS